MSSSKVYKSNNKCMSVFLLGQLAVNTVFNNSVEESLFFLVTHVIDIILVLTCAISSSDNSISAQICHLRSLADDVAGGTTNSFGFRPVVSFFIDSSNRPVHP